jgi:hypothetical protein
VFNVKKKKKKEKKEKKKKAKVGILVGINNIQK